MKNIFKTSRALRTYGICALSLSLLCVALRLIATLFFFDTEIGYYRLGNIVAFFAAFLPAICAAAALAFCAIPQICVKPAEAKNTRTVKISAFFPAAAFAAYTVLYALSVMEYFRVYNELPLAYILMLAASAVSAAFFLQIALRKNVGDAYFVVSGIFPIIWLVISLAESYFDSYVQINSPIKLIFQLATLGAMLLTVCELRVGLDVKKPRFHLFAATVAAVFLGTSSVPSIICFFTGHMPTSYVLLYSDCVLATLFVFAVARLCQLCFSGERENATDIEEVLEEDTQAPNDTQTTEDITENTTEDIS